MHTRCGEKPRDADGVIFDSLNENPDDALHGWRIYRRAAGALPWINLKVISQRPRKGAANYWLSWNTATQKFNRSQATARTPEAMRLRVASIMRDYLKEFPPGQAERYMVDIEAEGLLD